MTIQTKTRNINSDIRTLLIILARIATRVATKNRKAKRVA